MKKALITLTLLCSFFAAISQAPQAINYQAVARTSLGLILPDQRIGVRFTILEGTATGNILYQETANATTNNFGLFTLGIGLGTPVFGTFSNIPWQNGLLKYLKVEIAPGGGIDYTVQGTTVMLSVPYSLYSEKTRLVAGNAINITNGNTISAAYKGLTGVKISNDTISGNYTGTNGVAVTGSVISGNYIGGTGINITGNIISSTGGSGSSQWINHANGIYYPASGTPGNVGIRTTPVTNQALIINGDVPGVFEGNALQLTSSSIWHTAFVIENRTNLAAYAFVVGGNGNTEVKPRNLGLINTAITGGWVYTVDGTNNNMGLGDSNVSPSLPKSKLHLKTGDIYLEEIGRGIIMKSPNGQCWRITIDNAGNLVRTSIACP